MCKRNCHEVDIIYRTAKFSGMCAAPLEVAARFARRQASTALANFHSDGELSCWLLNESLLCLAASTEGCLLLVDLTQSASRGEVINACGEPTRHYKCPMYHFDFQAVALPFTACTENHELHTEGGELLDINVEHTTFLAAGWVAARPIGSGAFKWLPLDRCYVGCSKGRAGT